MKRALTYFSIATILMVFMIQTVDAGQFRRRPVRRHKVVVAPSLGIRFGNDFDNDQFLLGGHLCLPAGVFWRFVPSGEYYFTQNDSTRWMANVDFIFKPKPNGFLYFGGGIAMQHLSQQEMKSSTDFGGNLLVGIEFSNPGFSPMSPYLQARWTFLNEETYFSLLGGVNLILK